MKKSDEINRLDFNLFQVFDVIYREGNLTRAADILNITQPAISHSLSRLRDQLGDPLFVRDGFGVTPTELSHRMAPKIAEGISFFQTAYYQSREFIPLRDVHHCRIAIHSEAEASALPSIVQRMRSENDDIAVESLRLERNTMQTDLASGKYDFALDVAESPNEDLKRKTLQSSPFCIMSRTQSKWTKKAYLEAQHIAVSTRRSGTVIEDTYLAKKGFNRNIAVRCQQYEVAVKIATISDLILTLPKHLAHSLNTQSKILISPIPLPIPEVSLMLYWHANKEQDPRNSWLREKIKSAVKDL